MWVQPLGHEEPLEEEMATVFLPGNCSLVGYSPWGHKQLDMTEYTHIRTALPGEHPSHC